jgi:hypothetical protein
MICASISWPIIVKGANSMALIHIKLRNFPANGFMPLECATRERIAGFHIIF